MTKSFGSQIRGGESSCRLRLSTRPVFNPGGTLDVAVALNWDDFLKLRRRAAGRRQHRRRSTTRRAGSRPTAAARRRDARARCCPCRSARWPARRRAPTARRTSSCSGCSPGWFGIGRDAILRGHPQALREEGRASWSRRASAPSRPGSRTPPSIRCARGHDDGPAGADRGRQAPHRRQRDVRRGGDLRRLRVLRRLSDHAVHRDHAVPQPRDLEVRRRRCCRRRTRSPASAPPSAPRSPARRR